MTSDGGRVVPGPGVRPFELADHNCFACGSLNEHGLRLTLHVEPGRAWTEVRLDRRFEGWEGVAHGGIVTTILDEVMAWSLVGSGQWGLTARLSVAFRRPVPVDDPLRAEGWVAHSRRRIVDTGAHLVASATGEQLAGATGRFMVVAPGERRRLQGRYGFRYVDAVAHEAAVR